MRIRLTSRESNQPVRNGSICYEHEHEQKGQRSCEEKGRKREENNDANNEVSSIRSKSNRS